MLIHSIKYAKWFPIALLLLVTTTACDALLGSLTPAEPQILIPTVLNAYPHDVNAFTQGLVLADGRLYESTGLFGQSTLREVDLTTGAVLRSVAVAPEYFAEGLALVDDRLIQLTWQSGIALIYDRDTFAPLGSYTYSGEGWGLCYDGAQLYMSDGSSTLFIRDAQSFEIIRQVTVALDGQPVERLNELECVGDAIYANVWQTDAIVVIDKLTGRVRDVIDASTLLTPDERAQLTDGNAVLNGIAYDAERGHFYITGKLYPTLWEVAFTPQPGSN
ncbi:MAG: glutaminyl-peptide cyclotransferase [Armatimonadetes bacterium]|nr:glutaminyl-peptide cyclotransferase [Anaerolineae bacterium]